MGGLHMSCTTRIDLHRGRITVSGDDADEVHTVIVSVADHLRAFAHDHPSILQPLQQITQIHTGDHIDVSANVAAIGRGATLNVDLRLISADLCKLRSALRESATTVESDLELAVLAEAQLAADAGDENRLLAALKKVSSRALSVAREIGAEVAAAAISRAMGL
jgi:hypothetical protein